MACTFVGPRAAEQLLGLQAEDEQHLQHEQQQYGGRPITQNQQVQQSQYPESLRADREQSDQLLFAKALLDVGEFQVCLLSISQRRSAGIDTHVQQQQSRTQHASASCCLSSTLLLYCL